MNSDFVLGARDPFCFFEKLYRGQNLPYMLKEYMPRTRKHKKSKYKHLVINKKKFYFYKIKWLDITADGGHATPDEFDKFECSKMVSYGYVYKKTKKFLWTFASYDEKDEVYSDRNVFPIGCIIKMEKMNI